MNKVGLLKRLFLISSFAIAFISAYTQPQRMLVLPEVMSGAGNIASVCIDFFRAVPEPTHSYLFAIDGSNVSRAQSVLRGTSTTTRMDGAAEFSGFGKIYGTTAEAISPHYQSFLNERIKAYSKTPLTEELHQQLQDEIWSFDALQTFGHMRQTGNAVDDYIDAAARFSTDFSLSIENIAEDIVARAGLIKYGKDLSKMVEGPNRLISVFRNETTGRYFAFDGAKKPICSNGDVTQVADAIAASCKDNYTVYLSVNDFPSIDREEAFIFSVNNRLKTKHRGRNLTSVKTASIFHFEVIAARAHYAYRSSSPIQEITMNQAKLFEQEHKVLVDYLDEASLIARGNKRSFLTKFKDRLGTFFGYEGTEASLVTFGTSFRRDLINSLELGTDDIFEAELLLDAEVLRITKNAGSNEITVESRKW